MNRRSTSLFDGLQPRILDGADKLDEVQCRAVRLRDTEGLWNGIEGT